MSGPSTAMAGTQGNMAKNNGCCLVFDEMVDELIGNDDGAWAVLGHQ